MIFIIREAREKNLFNDSFLNYIDLIINIVSSRA